MTILTGDCRDLMPAHGLFDMILAEAGRLSGRRYLGCEIDAGMAERARARIASVLPLHGGGPARHQPVGDRS